MVVGLISLIVLGAASTGQIDCAGIQLPDDLSPAPSPGIVIPIELIEDKVVAKAASASASQALGDGVIGREFLNQFVVVYDYARQRITLFSPEERGAADNECRGTTVDIVADPEGVIVTMAQADQQPMRLLWDTGAAHSFVNKSFAEQHKLPVETSFYTAQRFKLGPANFGPLQFVVMDAKAPSSVDGSVGHDFFATHVVCIDPFNRVVKVRSTETALH